MPWLPLPYIRESHLSKHAAEDQRFFLVFHLLNVGSKRWIPVLPQPTQGSAMVLSFIVVTRVSKGFSSNNTLFLS
jgi:hypothetical protein